MNAIEKIVGSDWNSIIGTLLLSNRFKSIMSNLKEQKAQGITITPEPKVIFKPFRSMRVRDTKCIILGDEPFQTGCISGRAFATSKKTPPSIAPPEHTNILWLYETYCDTGNFLVYNDTELNVIADKGYLLLNCAYTAVVGKKYAHRRLWRHFTIEVLNAISAFDSSIPIVLVGTYAKTFKPHLKAEHILEHTYLSKLIKKEENLFKKIDDLLLTTKKKKNV